MLADFGDENAFPAGKSGAKQQRAGGGGRRKRDKQAALGCAVKSNILDALLIEGALNRH